MSLKMYDASEVTNDVLLSFDNWFKPFLDLIGGKVYLQSLIILLVFISAAKLLSFITTKAILNLSRKNKTIPGNRVVTILHVPVFYTIILLGIGTTMHWLDVVPWAYDIGVSLLSSFIIVLWAMFLIRLSRILLTTLANREKILRLSRWKLYLFF